MRDMPRHRYSIPAYIGAGGIATGCHYVTTIAAVELLGVRPSSPPPSDSRRARW
jgi:hypothetical protein